MYGLKYCRVARAVASTAVKHQSQQKHLKDCLLVPRSRIYQTANQTFFHFLCPSHQTILPKLKIMSSYDRRYESCSDSNINSSDPSLDVVRQELSEMRAIGKNVPEVISDADLEYYSTLTSKSGRKKFLNFLVKREGLRKREKLKKIQKLTEKGKISKDEEGMESELPLNRILRRISAVTMLAHDNWRLASAMKFGPQIAFDFSFDECMARPEIISMISQLTHVLNANKSAMEPFYMHWTGLKDRSPTLKEMKRMFGPTFQNIMVNITSQDVMDIFPQDKLIYLTADSSNIMHTFDAGKIYIIGGLVDARAVQTGITLAKAKRYNISHARFPLDLYLQWEMGAKTLTLDQVARILHTMRETQDWTTALKNVPIRKHSGFKMSHQENSEVLEKITTRPDLAKYFEKQKQAIRKGQERKESIVKDSARFSFSRAKREFKWDLLESDAKSYAKGTRGTHWDEELDDDFDPTGDTLFSSSGKVENKHRNRMRKSGSKWFEK